MTTANHHITTTDRWFLILTCAWTLFLVSCASEVVQNRVSDNEFRQTQHKSQYKVVAVDVLSDVKSEDIADQISASIVSKLRKQGAFERVLSKSATLEKKFDLVVFITPKDYSNRDISQAWVGVFGGRSSLEIQVVLLDGNTGQTLASGTIEGKAPTKTTLFSSSSMALAIDLVGEEAAKFVLNHTQ